MSPPNRGRAHTTEDGNARKRLPIESEAHYTLMPVRDHKEPGHPICRVSKPSQARDLTTDASKNKVPGQIAGKAEAAKPREPGISNLKARGRANTVANTPTTPGKPARHPVPLTEAIFTLMPVRDHKEPGQAAHRKAEVVLKPKGRPEKHAASHRPLIEKAPKKPGFWKSLFGHNPSPPAPNPPPKLGRASTVSKAPRARHEKSKHRRSLDCGIWDTSKIHR